MSPSHQATVPVIAQNNNLNFVANPHDDYSGITVIYGGMESGKTTVLKDAITKLLDARIFRAYASLADSEVRIFPTEYRLPANYERNPITGVGSHNEARTDADVVIVPEIKNLIQIDLLQVARSTGKPVFLEVNAENIQSALDQLVLLHQEAYVGFSVGEIKRFGHCKIVEVDGRFERIVEWNEG